MGIIANPFEGADRAEAIVRDAADLYEDRTEAYITAMQAAVTNLGDVRLEPYNLTVNYNIEPWLPNFVRPTRPTTPTFRTVEVDTPEAPTLEAIEMRELGDAPVEPDLTPYLTYQPPSQPNVAFPTAPSGVNPVLDPIIVPDRPDFTLPDVPVLFDIQIPDMPQIVLPELDAIRPNPSIDVPTDGALEWQEVPYASDFLTLLGTRLSQMAQDGLALPVAIERAIYDRARAREDESSRRAIAEVFGDMAERGMTEPNSILPDRLLQVRFENRSKRAGLNRDLAISQAEKAIEGVKYALGQGIQYEGMLIQANNATNERALRAATFMREWAITRVNALVAIENIRRDLYLADAQVWKTRIEGELAKLEILKAEIDAQRLVGEINKNLVDLYEARHRAIGELIDAYKADVEAAKVRGEINVQRLQGAELVVRRYIGEADAYGKAWDAFKTRVDAAQAPMKAASLMAEVFNIRMNGFKTRGEAYGTEAQTRIAAQGQQLDLFRAQLAGADQELRAQLGELSAQVQAFSAQTNLYQADGAIAQAESASHDRAVQLRIAQEKDRVDALIAQAQINSGHLQKNAELVLAALKAISDNYAQLIASAQSGVNYGASFSGSLSGNVGLSRSLGWSGEVTDHDGTGF